VATKANETFAIRGGQVPQVRKPEIEDRVVEAARRVFAAHGFAATTIAAVAAEAGVSTGNVYRYFDGKDALFAAAVPDGVARELRRLIRARVRALDGVATVDALPADAPYRLLSRELLAFCARNRHEVVAMLGRGEGTRFAGLADELVRALVRLAIAHGASLTPPVRLRAPARFVLLQLYRGFVGAMVAILARYRDEADLAAAVDRYAAYHLAGLGRLFADEAEER
jgi:AcrR family transcriptional regulator